MDNQEYYNQEAVILKERKKHSKGLWYWILALLVLILFGWYAYSAGWFGGLFGSQNKQIIDEYQADVAPAINTELENFVNQNEAGARPNIDSVNVVAGSGFPVDQQLVIKGTLANGCTYLENPEQMRSGNTFYVNLATRVEGDACTEALVNFEKTIPLQVNNLPAGNYSVEVNGQNSISFDLESNNVVNFSAGSDK